jgi:hypothetical protein
MTTCAEHSPQYFIGTVGEQFICWSIRPRTRAYWGKVLLKKILGGCGLNHPTAHPLRHPLLPTLLEPAMTYLNRIRDPEVAVASGELVPAQYLPGLLKLPSPGSCNSLESSSPPLSLKEKSPRSLPYNSFLIPRGIQPVLSPKTKPLSRCGRFQLWFNTYR